jgi:uncharacterized repeat protein (TIGR03803 family)
MPITKTSIPLVGLMIAALLYVVPPLFGADKEHVLHKFGKGSDGIAPLGNLIFDTAGNLYGTTYAGGKNLCGYDTGCGTIFELIPRNDGTWKEIVLHDFGSSDSDGFNPDGGLVFDEVGNLYGTTTDCNVDNCLGGKVFELSPQSGGNWKLSTLYAFTGGKDGGDPAGGNLIFDRVGNIYGTTFSGGEHDSGTVFELTRQANDTWIEKVLHSFNVRDGEYPAGGVVFDADGNLYGMTCCGGKYGYSCSPNNSGCGVIFELMPQSGGTWREKVIHNFHFKDGANAAGGFIWDAKGNLYGSTQWGGAPNSGCGSVNCGVVFELSRDSRGKWLEKILHRFNYADGSSPEGNLLLDAAGNLYGVTTFGGAHQEGCSYNCGVAFELVQGMNGKWTERVLHSFGGHDGEYPPAGLIFDAEGNLYGVTQGLDGPNCAGSDCGNVYKLTP